MTVFYDRIYFDKRRCVMADVEDVIKSLKLPTIISRVGSPFTPEASADDEQKFVSGYEIEILSGNDNGKIFPLNSKEIILGRKDANKDKQGGFIHLDEPTVSKTHAKLKWEPELEKFVIYNLSEASPTLVNNRLIKKSLLSADYLLTLGELNLKVISLKEQKRLESLHIWEKFKAGEKRGEVHLDTEYRLVIVEGPDKGKTFDLDKNLMIIGRRKHAADMRDTYGILLSDQTLPEELALLLWNDHEKRFCIYQGESEQAPLKLFRIIEHEDGAKVVGRDFENTLEDRDAIRAGKTVMVMHKLTSEETCEAKVDIERELLVGQDFVTEEVMIPQLAGGTFTAQGSFRVDYVFEIIEGEDKGHKISFLSDEMVDGKIITLGSPGNNRQNDVELNDPDINNKQGSFEFTGGNLFLVNEYGETEIVVNSDNVGKGERFLLNNGDKIRIGKTILSFFDNRTLAALRKYSLVVIAGGEQDQAIKFPLTKTMMFIGRGSACDVRVHDPEVSRLHAVFSFKNGRFYLEHKSKVNPTFVNGISLKKGQDRIIFPGDKIYLSSTSVIQLVRKR
jgi:pSer/pThr/pTyr-binding forkhead associated (FHA) protein